MFIACFFFKQKTAYEMRISDWSSDVCSSDLGVAVDRVLDRRHHDHEVDRQLHLHRRDERADDGGAAAHVVLHLLDAALGLEIDAAGVEGDALADQRERLGIAAAIPAPHHQVRTGGRSARDRERKGLLEGKRCSVSVALGGYRIIKKTNN